MNDISAYRLYVLFNVIKRHFDLKTYSVQKYGFGATKNLKVDNFERDRFKSTYFAIAKHIINEEHAKMIFAANLVRDTKMIPNDVNFDLNLLWKYSQNKVALLEDIQTIISSGLLTWIKNGDIIRYIISGELNIELVAYLSRILPLQALIEQTLDNQYMWEIVNNRIEKLQPFCRFNTTEEIRQLTDITKSYLRG